MERGAVGIVMGLGYMGVMGVGADYALDGEFDVVDLYKKSTSNVEKWWEGRKNKNNSKSGSSSS